MLAQRLLVSLPSKPSRSRFSSLICRGFIGVLPQRCQKRAFISTASSVACALASARPNVARNQDSQAVTSMLPFCVCSRMS